MSPWQRIKGELRPWLVLTSLGGALLASMAGSGPTGLGPTGALMVAGLWWTLRASLRGKPSGKDARIEWSLSALGATPSIAIAVHLGAQPDALSACVIVASAAGAAVGHRLATMGQALTGLCMGNALAGALAMVALKAATVGPETTWLVGAQAPTLAVVAGVAGAAATLALWHDPRALGGALALAWAAGAGIAQRPEPENGWIAVAAGVTLTAIMAPGRPSPLRTCAVALGIATLLVWIAEAETVSMAKAGVLTAITLTLGRELILSHAIGRVAPKAGHILILTWLLATWGLGSPALLNAEQPLMLAGLVAPPWNARCSDTGCASTLVVAGLASLALTITILALTNRARENAKKSSDKTHERIEQGRDDA